MKTLSEPRIKAAREPAAKRYHIKVAAQPAAKKKVDARTKAFLDAVMALKLWGKCAFYWTPMSFGIWPTALQGGNVSGRKLTMSAPHTARYRQIPLTSFANISSAGPREFALKTLSG